MTLRSCVAICVVSAVAVVSGCGGRSADPVTQYQPGDEERTCQGLESEVLSNENEMAELMPHEDATGKNVALGVTGAFLIVPWFFMDFKDAEATEIKALERRNRWLRELGARKDCDIPPSKFLGEVKACTEAKDAEKPWIGNWVAKAGKDILAVDISTYQINGQLITSGGTYDVDGRVDDEGAVDAEITSSWAKASLKGTFPALAARATGEKRLGAVRSEADTIFTLCN